jgi:hypothetical protein
MYRYAYLKLFVCIDIHIYRYVYVYLYIHSSASHYVSIISSVGLISRQVQPNEPKKYLCIIKLYICY